MIVSVTGNKTTIMQSYVSGESYPTDFQQVEQVHAAARVLQRFWRAHKVRRFYSLSSNVGDETDKERTSFATEGDETDKESSSPK